MLVQHGRSIADGLREDQVKPIADLSGPGSMSETKVKRLWLEQLDSEELRPR